MTPVPTPTVPVSWGELFDKLTILAIKRERLPGPAQRANVAREHALLAARSALAHAAPGVAGLVVRLRRINEALWDIEDAIRVEDAAGRFEGVFIDLARSVYRTNDRRALIKREIDRLLGSELREEKSYAAFGPAPPAAAAARQAGL